MVISVLQPHRVEKLKSTHEVIEINRFDVAGIPVVRFALVCYEPPPESPIEAIVPDSRYCPECIKRDKLTPLAAHNRTGYCTKHRELSPMRLEKKRSPKNRQKSGG